MKTKFIMKPLPFILIALLIAVFPANLNMLLNDILPDTILGPTTRTALWLRLPVQFLLAAWAWRYTRVPRHDTGLRHARVLLRLSVVYFITTHRHACQRRKRRCCASGQRV